MSQEELYLFDLTGYLVVEDALTQEAVATANQAIDQERDKIRLRPRDQRMDGDSEHLRGEHGRDELGGLLELDPPWCDLFRLMLAHPKIVPYLSQILGQGFRLDHHPSCCQRTRGRRGIFPTALPAQVSIPINTIFSVMDGCTMV